MSAGESLGAQFQAHVEAFREHAGAKDWETPEGAEDCCGRATQQFRQYSQEHGHDVGDELLKMPGHHYNTYRGHAIDWTARQHWPDAPVPLVEPEEKYLQRKPSSWQDRRQRENGSDWKPSWGGK